MIIILFIKVVYEIGYGRSMIIICLLLILKWEVICSSWVFWVYLEKKRKVVVMVFLILIIEYLIMFIKYGVILGYD